MLVNFERIQVSLPRIMNYPNAIAVVNDGVQRGVGRESALNHNPARVVGRDVGNVGPVGKHPAVISQHLVIVEHGIGMKTKNERIPAWQTRGIVVKILIRRNRVAVLVGSIRIGLQRIRLGVTKACQYPQDQKRWDHELAPWQQRHTYGNGADQGRGEDHRVAQAPGSQDRRKLIKNDDHQENRNCQEEQVSLRWAKQLEPNKTCRRGQREDQRQSIGIHLRDSHDRFEKREILAGDFQL